MKLQKTYMQYIVYNQPRPTNIIPNIHHTFVFVIQFSENQFFVFNFERMATSDAIVYFTKKTRISFPAIIRSIV